MLLALVTSDRPLLVLAKAGHRVIGVDVNAQVVATVNEGRIHIVEPDLDQAVAQSVASVLSAQVTPAPADVFLDRRAHPIPQRGRRHSSAQHRLCACRRPRHCAGDAPRQSLVAGIHLAGGHHRAGGPGDRRSERPDQRAAPHRLLP